MKLGRDVRDHVRECQHCIVSKIIEPEGRAPLVSVSSSRPLELVCINFWSAEASNNKSVDVLVTQSQTTSLDGCMPPHARTSLLNRLQDVSGTGTSVCSAFQKGYTASANLLSQLISELLGASGVKKIHKTPYHPMGNSSMEPDSGWNDLCPTLPPDSKVDWPRRLQTVTFM